MVSRPDLRPQQVRRADQGEGLERDRDNPDNPMLNRAIQAQLAPGSTFKPIVALAALETGTIDDKFTGALPGRRDVLRPLLSLLDEEGPRHGDAANGIVHSCDSYFYTIGNKAGIDNIAFYADMVGFGQNTGIDLPNEAEGTCSLGAVEAAQLPDQVVCGRDAFGGHRAGRADGNAAATGARHRRDCHGRRVASRRTW